MAAEDKIKNLKTQLREATNEARELGVQLANIGDNVDPSKVAELEANFAAATKRAAKLTDDVKDVNEQIKVLTSGSKFEKVSNSIGDISGKIASLDFGGAAESANRLVELTKTIKFGDAIKGVKELGSTLANLGKALLTNPLFLIVAAIAAIGLAVKGLMDKQRADVDAANKAIKDSNESRINEERKLLAQVNNDAIASYQLKKKLGEQNLADTKAQIKNLEDLESSLSGLSEEQETELANLRKQYNQQRVDNELLTINEINRINGLIRDYQKETFKLGLNDRNKELDDLTDWYIEQQRLIGDNNQAKIALDANFNAKQKALTEKFRDEDAKTQKERSKNFADANAEIKKNQEDLIIFLEGEDSFKAQQIKINRFYDDLAKKKGITDAQLIQLEKQKQAELDALAAKELARTQNTENEITKIVIDNSGVRLATTTAADAQVVQSRVNVGNVIKEKTNEEIALDEQKNIAKVRLATDAFGALGDLASAFVGNDEKNARKAFEVNKAFSLGSAIANTGLAVTGALTAGGNPIKLATGQQFVEAGIAATVGLANIVKIAKSKFSANQTTSTNGGTSRPSIGNSTASTAPATPSFNLFGTGGQMNNLGAGAPTSNSPQPLAVQVSISETEITKTQSFVKKVQESATL